MGRLGIIISVNLNAWRTVQMVICGRMHDILATRDIAAKMDSMSPE